MLDIALCYAGRGWRIFPVHGINSDGGCTCSKADCRQPAKHPRVREWQKVATHDRDQVVRWWTKWPDANIGLATGPQRDYPLTVLDFDNRDELAWFLELARNRGAVPAGPMVQTGRGLHLYLRGAYPTTRKVGDEAGKVLVRGTGGFVIVPPSRHASGRVYQWYGRQPLEDFPAWMPEWLASAAPGSGGDLQLGAKPGYLSGTKPVAGLREALAQPWTAHAEQRIRSALAAISADCERDDWLRIGMALHGLGWQRPDGTDAGFELWLAWSATARDKFQGEADLEVRWNSFGKRDGVSLGTLFHLAEKRGWLGYAPEIREEVMPTEQVHANPRPEIGAPLFEPTAGPAHVNGAALAHLAEPTKHMNGHANGHALPLELTAPASESPLIELNHKYAVIGDLGGKCMVMGWVPSKADPAIEVPSFQSFKSFAERYGHRYIQTTERKLTEEGEKESPVIRQLGLHWLKWSKRRSYEGIDLSPGHGEILPNGALNLWRGFAVAPAPGRWDLMREHIRDVLADGDEASADYITRWGAWSVQHPGERAEAALVLRGGKGTGKGTFAHAMRRIFGTHGLHISNARHLTGNFNAHLATCLMLYADEAFWAGDKQGESTLKSLITEQTLMVEKKGVDAMQWQNRLHVMMTANAEWVVPASHDERRYAVFNVAEKRMGDRAWFQALHAELAAGGLAAMLWDLQRMDLGDWHPRQVVRTAALAEQQAHSMAPLEEWWAGLLEDGVLPAAGKDAPAIAPAGALLIHAREAVPRLRDLTATRLGRFLRAHGGVVIRRATHNAWRLPELYKAREAWSRRYQGWAWETDASRWVARG